MKSNIFYFAFFILLLFSLGCSSGTRNATIPENPASVHQFDQIPVGVSDWLPDGSPSGGMGTLGLFNLHLDPSAISAELTSLRESALTDALEVVDITNFLQMAPCTNCVKIKNVSLDADGNIVVNIGVKHPFPAGDPFKPITGRNRADLHVFNIEGIIISNLPGREFIGVGESVAGFDLVNGDGFTGYLDGVIDEFYPTDATIHPYILHFDDYSRGNFDPLNPTGFQSVTDPPPMGNLVMAMGCDYNFQDYVFKIDPSAPVDFIYAVGCTYAISSVSKSQRFNPEYRIPQHNKKAASEVRFEIVSNDLTENDPASSAQIAVKVLDINHGVAVGDALDQMSADSSVSGITIDIPGLLTTPLNLDTSSPTGTGHSPSDPLVFPGTIMNSTSAPKGTYPGIIKVIDSYQPGSNSSPLLEGKDGIKRVDPLQVPTSGLFDISQFYTCQTFSIDVTEEPYIPVLTLVHDSTTNPDLPNSFSNMDMDNADERGPCLNWEEDGEYCINCSIQFFPFDNVSTNYRMTSTMFTTDLVNITENYNTWRSGQGFCEWNKTYTNNRIDATYASWHEVDGLQHPIAIADHTAIASWGGGWAYMDHSDEIFVSRVTGRCFILGDHSHTVRYAISNAQDTLPFELYDSSNVYTSNIGTGYLSECHSMEDDSTGRIYLAYFDGSTINDIRLARSTDLDLGHAWQITSPFNGGIVYSEVRDPGIAVIDDNGVHISFSRRSIVTGLYELVYMRSDNGGDTFSSPIVVSTSANAIHDTPVEYFTESSLPGYQFVIMIYETNSQVYLNWSSDRGVTWQTTPVQISQDGFTNHDPDFVIDPPTHNIHVIYVEDNPVTYGDIIIANYHFELI